MCVCVSIVASTQVYATELSLSFRALIRAHVSPQLGNKGKDASKSHSTSRYSYKSKVLNLIAAAQSDTDTHTHTRRKREKLDKRND